MIDVLTYVAIGALNIVCFFIGAKIGQKIVKGEEVKLSDISFKNPIKEYKKNKQAEAEQAKIDTILQNIETYNGTSSGQKDV